MPRVDGLRERRHQPYYDTLIRVKADTAPTPTLTSTTRLFASGTNLGQTEWTNMVTAGVLPGDQSYIVLAMRVWLHFEGSSALTIYQRTAVQLYLKLIMSDKPQFLSPAWMFPAGGGIWGMDSTTPTCVNGVPSSQSILRFGKPIPMPPRQPFYCEASFYPFGTNDVMTNYLNASTSVAVREIKVFIDGLHTRDVL